jgi:hypothetical protein
MHPNTSTAAATTTTTNNNNNNNSTWRVFTKFSFPFTWQLMQEAGHCNLRKLLHCSWCSKLFILNSHAFLDSHTASVIFRTCSLTTLTIKIYESCISISSQSLCFPYREKKFISTWTHACYSKINNVSEFSFLKCANSVFTLI